MSDRREYRPTTPRYVQLTSLFAVPTFLSARSADVILSEIRPTKLNSEAWRSINVLLDELLWLILSAARSFSTEAIKAALLKVLPTPLGKEALLEAEVELRAYWERTASSTPSRSYAENVQEFPLQPAYEVRESLSQRMFSICFRLTQSITTSLCD